MRNYKKRLRLRQSKRNKRQRLMEGEEITLTVEELTGNVASEQSCPLVPPPDVQTKTKLENNLKSVTAK